MVEGLKSYGEFLGVDIYRHEGMNGVLSGIIFGAEGMLLTARHVVDSRMIELSDFVFFPEYDCQEVDIAVRKDPAVRGPQLGYVDGLALAGCYCVTSRVSEPDKLIRVTVVWNLFTTRPF